MNRIKMKFTLAIIGACCAIAACVSAQSPTTGEPQNIEDIFDVVASGLVNIIGLPRRGATGNESVVATEPKNVLDIVDAIQSGSVILLGLGGDGSVAASQPQDYAQLFKAIGAGVANIIGYPGQERDAGGSSNATNASSQPQSIYEIVRAVQRGSLVVLGLPRRGLTDANQNQGRKKRSISSLGELISGRSTK